MGIIKYFILIFSIASLKLFGQDEFLSDKNGLMFVYQRGVGYFAPNNYAVGAGFHLKNGFTMGFGLQQQEELSIPIASIGYLARQKPEKNLVSPGAGLTYGYNEDYHLFALNIEVYKCIFPESRFPFALSGLFSFESGWDIKKAEPLNLIPLLGLNYSQVFFQNKIAYPLIGITGIYALNESTGFLIFNAGLNVNLGTYKKAAVVVK
jgi:hypothetical protein